MTSPQHPDVSEAEQHDSVPGTARVQRHLAAATEHLEVVAAPVDALKDRAHRRTARRRRAAAIGVVAAASIGVVGGIAVLTRSEPTQVVTSSEADPSGDSADATDSAGTPSNTTTDQLPPATDPSVGGSPASAVPATTGANDPFGDLAPAQIADPSFVWKVVDPGKEVSISSTFGRQSDATFPTFAFSTAPGRSNDYDNLETFLYRSEDGINWTQTNAQSPFASGYWNAMVNADTVFVTGTAPGIAGTDPNPLQVAAGSGEEWNIAELPIDTNAATVLPLVTINGPNVGAMRYGDGVLVVTTEQTSPDYQAISESFGDQADGLSIVDQRPDGMVLVERECMEGAETTWDPTVELFGPENGAEVAPSTIPMVVEDGDDFFGCPATVKTWSELGLPQESIDALSAPMSRFFLVSATLDVTEIDGPADGGFYAVDGQRPIVETAQFRPTREESVSRFEYVDGIWIEAASLGGSPLTRLGVELRDLGGQQVGLFEGQPDGRVPFMSIAPDGTQQGTDLQALLSTDAPVSESWSQYRTVAADRWVGAVQTYDDPIALNGGLEVVFGDVLVRQASQRARYELVDAVSGEPIDLALIDGDSDGNIEVRDAIGSVRAEFNVEDLYQALQPTGDQPPPLHRLLTTADGESFAVESIAELLGVADEDILRTSRVASDGVTVIVTVTMNERYADDIPKQLVLVGTPIG